MDYSPLATSSRPTLPIPTGPPFAPAPAQGLQQASAADDSDSMALLEVLRRAHTSGHHPTDSMLRAVTDAARILVAADGTALALRIDGDIVCRARSGAIAPELGAPLNTDSGISGECLRTATIMVCNDTATDSRVDPEVCRTLGVRSIVAVPVRGTAGIVGILSAFSARPDAFGAEQIDSLRALSEIAEGVNSRESEWQHPDPAGPTPAVSRPALFAPPGIKEETTAAKFSDEYSPKRRYWIAGAVGLALLLTAAVAWFSWRSAAAETAASEATIRTANTPQETSSIPVTRVPAPKPNPTIASRESDRLRGKDVLRNAAEIQPATDNGRPSDQETSISLLDRPERTTAVSAPSSDSDPPPSVEVTSTAPEGLADLSPAATVTPALGAPVSQGIKDAVLIHKVNPTYPTQARVLRLSGSVKLDITIAEDGAVRDVQVVGGPPVLVAAATEAVRQWRYSPSLLSGKPIEVQKRITLVFKLP